MITNLVIGQKDYKAGYIISNNKDTIYGYINLKSNYHNSQHCEFKKELHEEVQIYNAYQLKAYRIEDIKYYVARDISLDSLNRRLFLEYLLSGIVNLYYLKDLNNKEYYFIEKENKMHQISDDIVEIRRQGAIYTKHSNRYKGLLTYLFKESPEMADDIQHLKFDYSDLIDITQTYHNNVCTDYTCVIYSKSTKAKYYLEPYTGLINAWMGLISSANHAYDFKPYIGINLRRTPVKIHYLWNFLVGINYSSNKFQKEFTNTLYDDIEKIYLIYARYDILRIPIMVEYTFPTQRIQPFITAGYTNIIILNPNYDAQKVTYITEDFIHFGQHIYSRFRPYQYGFMGGLGVTYKFQNSNYLYLRGNFEYRVPYCNFHHLFDYHHVKSLMFTFGYGFGLN